ncbi:MAG: hypothetical protein M2R45_05423 [Verrucomicrobia subdivision 3 bacterium]|nr:hypothetical protein [Limisphaerales bacterium]MCS1413001.1 hypothetical protein [Limisphaerales bacterium]
MNGDALVRWINATSTTFWDYDIRNGHNRFRNRVHYSTANCIVVGDSFVEANVVSENKLHTTLIFRDASANQEPQTDVVQISKP